MYQNIKNEIRQIIITIIICIYNAKYNNSDMKKEKKYFIILSIIIILSSLYIIKKNFNNTNLYKSKLIEVEKNYFNKQCQKGDQTYCTFSMITNLALTGKLTEARMQLKQLDLLGTTNEKIMCHDISHLIGRVSYYENGIEHTIKQIENGCAGGIHHGAFEEWGLTTDIKDMQKISERLCSEFNKNSITEELCYHGIGHAIKKANLDLKQALSYCSELIPLDKITLCGDGAVSTAVLERQAKNKGKIYIDDLIDLLSTCNTLEIKYKYLCAKNVSYETSRTKDNQTIKEIIKICQENYNYEFNKNCILGVGHALAFINRENPKNLIDICYTVDISNLDACLSGASRWIAVNLKDINVAKEICAYSKKENELCLKLENEYENLIK